MPTVSKKLLMLIVDDEQLIRRMLMEFFKNGPYEFLEAADGQEALRSTLANCPDIIITDLMLPLMDGADMIRSLRTHKDFATTPIVAVTAGSDEMKEQARKAGAHAVLSKPLHESDVVRVVEDLLAVTPFMKR